MKKDDLLAYEERERQFVREHGRRAIKGGIVHDIKRIYPDIQLPRSYGVQRKGAPLTLLCFLYPNTLVYVPPTSKKLLEKRLGIDIENFVYLAEKGVIQPLIGHPEYYADLPHLDPILKLKPPSVWARGYGLLDLLNAEHLFESARRDLPIKKLTQIREVREHWRAHFPDASPKELTQKIELELCTNYVDLCIFGQHELVEEICAHPPSHIPQMLLSANEIATYPFLFGLGGTPNYSVEAGSIVKQMRIFQGRAVLGGRKAVKPYIIPEALRVVLQGLGISFPERVTADDVYSFHKSGMAKKLRTALEQLEQELEARTANEARITDKAEYFMNTLTAVLRATREVNHWRPQATQIVGRTISWVLQTMAFSVGYVSFAATSAIDPVAGLSAGLGASWATFNWTKQLIPIEKVQTWLVDKIAMGKFSPVAANLWHVARWRQASG